MPQRRTQFVQGEYYHIYNRGAGRRKVFREADNYLFAIGRAKYYAPRYQVAVIAYCLLPNHYHFLVRQDGDTSAGLLVQHVFNSYSKAYNRRYGRSGTLFEGRFRAIHIDEQSHLIHLRR